jgi:hypothetical protein
MAMTTATCSTLSPGGGGWGGRLSLPRMRADGRRWQPGNLCEGRVREGDDAPDNPWQVGRVVKVSRDGTRVLVHIDGAILKQEVGLAPHC